MYNDYRKGYNPELVSHARTILASSKLEVNNQKIANSYEYDKEGNVIRDFKKELNVYVDDENNHLLPNVELGYFDSYRTYNKLRTERNTPDFKPIVITHRMPELIEVPQKKTFSFRTVVNSFLAMF